MKFIFYALFACLIVQNQLQASQMSISAEEQEKLDSALYYATSSGDEHKLEETITAGANVNKKYFGDYPIAAALRRGDVDIVNILIRAGANVNVKSTDGYPIIIDAVTFGGDALGKVKALLDAKVKIDAQDPLGNTALMWAAYKNKPEILQLLLNKGANPYIKNTRGTIDDPVRPIGRTVFNIAENKPEMKKILDDYIQQHKKAMQQVAEKAMKGGVEKSSRGKFSKEGEQLLPQVAQYF